jgi:hypothetical protein
MSLDESLSTSWDAVINTSTFSALNGSVDAAAEEEGSENAIVENRSEPLGPVSMLEAVSMRLLPINCIELVMLKCTEEFSIKTCASSVMCRFSRVIIE